MNSAYVDKIIQIAYLGCGINHVILSRHELIFELKRHENLQGRVVRKPVNTNPGLKVNQSIKFSCIKMFFTAYVLCSLRLFKLKTEGQTI